MFRGKIRMHTCRIILFTSLVWFLLDVAVLVYYSDSDSSSSSKSKVGPVADAHPSKRDADHLQTANHFDSIKSHDDEVSLLFNLFFYGWWIFHSNKTVREMWTLTVADQRAVFGRDFSPVVTVHGMCVCIWLNFVAPRFTGLLNSNRWQEWKILGTRIVAYSCGGDILLRFRLPAHERSKRGQIEIVAVDGSCSLGSAGSNRPSGPCLSNNRCFPWRIRN